MTDNQLVIPGERKREIEEKKDNIYRSEREYGSFCRSVPLPESVKVEDVKATFTNGVLEDQHAGASSSGDEGTLD